uniref:Uncharacterized protein n=1 Tax=Sipha flava TaxID=143950 RepID=A0A2S2R0T7_9HEMI
MQSGHPGTSAQGHHDNNGGAAFAASASSAGEASYGGSVKAPAAHAGADYGHESAGHGKPGSPMMVHTKTNYDDIFNVRVACSGGDVVVETRTHTPNILFVLTERVGKK